MDPSDIAPLAVTLPGMAPALWLTVWALLPLGVVLLADSLFRHRAARLPPALRGGAKLAVGLTGAAVAALGSWLISSNGAWRTDDTFYLRASRAFLVELPVEQLRPDAAAPLSFDTLTADGRLRAPGYAAGWYRDPDGRRVFVLWSGAPLTRIPTDRNFDIALAIADPAALR